MENIGDFNWESIFQTQDYNTWVGFDEMLSGYYDSSSPDRSQPFKASKNTVSERNRRTKLNDRLFALRAVVPNISKASIIKDAIDYIQKLHDEERRIQSEMTELESRMLEPRTLDFGQKTGFISSTEKSKKKKMERSFDHIGSKQQCPIEVIELSVSYMGENTVMISLKCRKRRDTIVKLCEVFESLKLKIVTANISSFSESLFNTLFIQAEEKEMDFLRIQIETGIAALNDPYNSPMSM